MLRYSWRKVIEAWGKARPVEGVNPNVWRKDFAGAWIRRFDYGQQTMYGWDVDTIRPVSHGGGTDEANLAAMHWKNRASKGEDYPRFKTSVTARENMNIHKTQEWEIE